ncbi:MAG: hypothetical protein WC473_03875 [Patescibacteria group bacterium]
MAMSVRKLVDLVGLRMAYKIAEKRFVSIESFLNNLTFADLERYLEHFSGNFGDFDLFTDPLKHRLMETASSFSDWHRLYQHIYSGRDWERVILDSLIEKADTLEELLIVSGIMLSCANHIINDKEGDPDLSAVDPYASIRRDILVKIGQKTQEIMDATDCSGGCFNVDRPTLRFIFTALSCIYDNARLELTLSSRPDPQFILMRDKALENLRILTAFERSA